MSDISSLVEARFDPQRHNKYATLMAAGNGYLGIRATHEEGYTTQTRGMFLAGLYHRAGEEEPRELVNLPDVVGMHIEIDGEIVNLLAGKLLSYRRELRFATGELRREAVWESVSGQRYTLLCERFLSSHNKALFCQRISITPHNSECCISIATGIDATQTNAGRQHLDETQVRVFDQQTMQAIYRTRSKDAHVAITCACLVSPRAQVSFSAKNRRLQQHSFCELKPGETLTLDKYCLIERWLDGEMPNEAGQTSLAQLSACMEQGYEALLGASAAVWQAWWRHCRVRVQSATPDDQRALDFALYHLAAMTPVHDERSSIGAKGLTGEGYKGHVFWDTEVFLLPVHLHTQPEIARQLLRYRWLNLAGAHKKAQQNGFAGALFPWESGRTGEEETPAWAAINIRTGLRQKVASALAEHHLVADIAWAVVAYYQATGDEAFMAKEGVELLKETARFWLSRATEVNGALELHDVIGPDEYTEHVNNNAYTNYLACYNVAMARHFGKRFSQLNEAFSNQLDDFLARLRLPQPRPDGVIPQDDTFFSKPTIDLTRYKANAGSQSVLLDYSRAEVNEMQILKQADVVMLLYMLPWLYGEPVLRANLDYYEPRTIHDSSLSKAIHGIVAARCHEPEQAYRFWREGCQIDLGDAPHSSDDGIHAAASGAIWLGAVQGFAGVVAMQDELHINPALPKAWTSVAFPCCWRGRKLYITLTHQQLSVESDGPVTLHVHGKAVEVDGRADFFIPASGSGTSQEGI